MTPLTFGPDAQKPPLTEPRQIKWRLETADGLGIHTNGTICWLGWDDTVVRQITPELYNQMKPSLGWPAPVAGRY